MTDGMTSSRPYLLRAMYQWLIDNQKTPYILVDTEEENVMVPERFIDDGKIVLNITPSAISHLELGDEAVTFQAKFSGVMEHIYVPVISIMAIYAYENGRGMVFGEEDSGDDGDDNSPKKPSLRVIK